MKRILSSLLAALVLLSALACGVKNPGAPTAEATAEPVAAVEAPTVSAESTAEPEPTLPPVEASETAQWIWDDSTENNVWLYFQRTVTLDSVPDSAIAKIAACDKYWLYVNGTLAVIDGSLKRGPNGTDGWYDIVNLAPFLRDGENILAVKAWYWGRRAEGTSASHQFTDRAGFLFDAEVGDQKIVSNANWLVYRETAFQNDSKSNPAPMNRLPEYNITYNAETAISDDWLTVPMTGEPWRHAVEIAPAESELFGTLYERPIPLIAFGELTDFENGADWIGHRTERKEDIVLRLPANIQFTVYLKTYASRSREITITTENSSLGKTYVKYITAPEGETEFEELAWMNGDTCILSVPGGVTILDVKYRPSGYASEVVGSFSMEDEFFNELYRECVITQLVCMRETFMDCPDRERTQWWGDVTSQMTQTLYGFDSEAWKLYEKGLVQKLGFLHDNRFSSVMPSEEDLELPAQELAGIVGTWTYYRYTGRTEAVELMVDAYLSYLTNWTLREDGLVEILPTRNWSAETWYDAYTGADALILENAWYYWALKATCSMAELTGRDTAWLTERMTSIEAAFDNAFWTENGYMTEGRTVPDDRANAVAVLSGLAKPEHYHVIRSVLTTTVWCGTYMEKYVEEALCEMGYVSDALERMQSRYAPMLVQNAETGTTTIWEYWDLAMGTENHAWSAGPMLVLPKYVAGIRPTSTGYKTYELAPDFSHGDTVSAAVPTVLGMIDVNASNDGIMRLTLPVGGTASVRIPNAAGKTVHVNGTATESTPDGDYVWVTVTEAGPIEIAAR